MKKQSTFMVMAKFKNVQNLRIIIPMMAILLSSVINGYSQAHVTLATENCTVTQSEIKFKVTVCNDGTVPLSFNAMGIRISFNSAILNGSPIVTCNLQDTSNLAGNSDFPLVFQKKNHGGDWTDSYISSSYSMDMTNSTGIYTSSGEGNDIAVGQCKVLGVFNFVSSTNFNPGVPVNLTWLNNSGVVLYVNGASGTTNFQADLPPIQISLSTPCSLTTPLPAAVPTLSEWGLISLSTLLVGFGVLFIRNKMA